MLSEIFKKRAIRNLFQVIINHQKKVSSTKNSFRSGIHKKELNIWTMDRELKTTGYLALQVVYSKKNFQVHFAHPILDGFDLFESSLN